MDKFCEKIQQQLTGVQMDVRDGFWEEIEACLPVAATTPDNGHYSSLSFLEEMEHSGKRLACIGMCCFCLAERIG